MMMMDENTVPIKDKQYKKCYLLCADNDSMCIQLAKYSFEIKQ